jgi:hypothetical protein
MNFKRLRWVVSLPEHGTTAHGRKVAVRPSTVIGY